MTFSVDPPHTLHPHPSPAAGTLPCAHIRVTWLSLLFHPCARAGRMIANMSPLVAGIGEPAASTPLTLISGYNGGLVVQQDGGAGDKQWQETKHIVLSRAAIESATSFVAEHGLLMKVYFRNDDGSCCMASCGDFDYTTEQAEFFYGCGEFPYTADDAGSRTLDPAHRALLHTAPFPITRVPYDVDAIFALNPMKLVILTNTPDETVGLFLSMSLSSVFHQHHHTPSSPSPKRAHTPTLEFER